MSKLSGAVAVVVPNWNGADHLADCLDSLQKQTLKPHIIVVDNGSVINPIPVWQQKYPSTIFISNDINTGFAGGNNIGIKAATGDYLFLVNNDTEFTPGLLEGLLEVFDKYPDAGMVSPKFHYLWKCYRSINLRWFIYRRKKNT